MKKLLVLGFIFYVFLSWVVFFRFEWALSIYAKNYPDVALLLPQIRDFLLKLYLNTVPTLLFGALVVGLFAAYLYSLRDKLTAKSVIIYAILFQIIVLFSYPILSTDIYGYIVSDRLAIVHNSNVWTTKPNAFPEDKFYNLADYTDQVRIYGPVNQGIYAIPTVLSGDDVLTNVLVHKLVVMVFVIASLFVVKKINSDPKILALIFWNPLLVLETAGSGHNDIIMLFFLLLCYLFFTNKRYLLAGLMAALSVQVKATPLLLLPFIFIFFIKNTSWKAMLQFFVSFVAVYLITFLPMQTSFGALLSRQAQATGAYWQSLPLLIDRYIQPLAFLLKIALPLVLLVQATRTFLGENPWRMFVQTLFIYLLFFLPTLWNWYPLWVLALAPLLFSLKSRTVWAIVGMTFGALFAYVVYWTGQRIDYFQSPIWQVIMYGVILVPTLVGLNYEKFIKKS